MPFDFNLYSACLLPAFIQGCIFCILLIIRYLRDNRLSDILLAGILLILTLKVSFWMLGFAGWYNLRNGFTTFMFYFPFNNFILIGVLWHFYFLALTNAQFKLEARYWGHWVLPILYIILIVSKLIIDFGFFYPFPTTEEFQGGTRGYLAELDKSDWLAAISYFSFFFYTWLTFKNFRDYQNYIRQYLSFGEEVKFTWLENVLLVATLVVLIFFGLSILELLGFNFSYKQAWYAYLLLGVGIYYISLNAYYANPKQLALLQFSNEAEPPQSIDNERFNLELKSEISQLEQFIQSEKPYLNPELTLPELAKKISMNINQLSKTINEGIGQNFNDYINQYRVEAVINRLQQDEHLKHTLLGIALDCGFNSKATFNRAFKKVKGITPSDFVKSLIIK